MSDLKMIMENGIEMYVSLISSVKKAGGSTDPFRLEKLKDMTVMELFSRLATNGVRFTCKKE